MKVELIQNTLLYLKTLIIIGDLSHTIQYNPIAIILLNEKRTPIASLAKYFNNSLQSFLIFLIKSFDLDATDMRIRLVIIDIIIAQYDQGQIARQRQRQIEIDMVDKHTYPNPKLQLFLVCCRLYWQIPELPTLSSKQNRRQYVQGIRVRSPQAVVLESFREESK